MKLRIKGNSLRLRLSRSEVDCLLAHGRIEETIYFASGEAAKLTYALEHADSDREIWINALSQSLTIFLSTESATRWCKGVEVGIYGDSDTDHGVLELMVEKDFACLDRSDAENEDTFPNPHAGLAC